MPQHKRFKDIKINTEALSTVGEFKPISGRGKKIDILDKQTHDTLIYKKFEIAKKMDGHITLFRVSDKKALAGKETKEHTVPGPKWTPPSSVGFVMGSLSQGHRIWLATKPTNNQEGLLGKQNEPSIYAREITTAVSHGWAPRSPKLNEKYGCTGRGPNIVLTPPSTPRLMKIHNLQTVMDVKAGWNTFPISADNLMKASTTFNMRLQGVFNEYNLLYQESPLDKDCFDNQMLNIMLDPKILPLLEDGAITLEYLIDIGDQDILELLLKDQEIHYLLSEETMELNDVIDLYYTYIEDSSSCIGEFSFTKLCDLVNNTSDELSKLLSNLNVSISDIITFYNKNPKMFFDFANDATILFLKNNEMELDDLITIYNDNNDLFWSLVLDKEDLLQNISFEEFINRYEQAQSIIAKNSIEDPYDCIHSDLIEEGCPDEFLGKNTDYDNNY